MKRSHEPIFWSLFGAGGVLSALLAPVLILITGILLPIHFGMPAEALAYDRVLAFAKSWIGKVLMLAVISTFLFHAVHRIYHGLHDLGVHPGGLGMAIAYGSAFAGTAAAALLLFRIGV